MSTPSSTSTITLPLLTCLPRPLHFHTQTNRKNQTARLPPTTTSVTSQDKKAITQVLHPSSSPCPSPARPPRPPPSITTSIGATPTLTTTTTTLTCSPRRNTAPTPPAGHVSPCLHNSQHLALIHNAVILVLVVVVVVMAMVICCCCRRRAHKPLPLSHHRKGRGNSRA